MPFDPSPWRDDDRWAEDVRRAFSKGQPALLRTVNSLGLTALADWFHDTTRTGDQRLGEFLIECLDAADNAQAGHQHIEARARRAGARGFQLLGEPPSPIDAERIKDSMYGPSSTKRPRASLVGYRDVWARICYDEVKQPGARTTPSPKNAGRGREDYGEALVDAIETAVRARNEELTGDKWDDDRFDAVEVSKPSRFQQRWNRTPDWLHGFANWTVFALAIGVPVALLTYGGFWVIAPLMSDATTNRDPVTAAAHGSDWTPGIGPSNELRQKSSSSKLLVNPIIYANDNVIPPIPTPRIAEGSFVTLDNSSGGSVGGSEISGPGKYKIKVSVDVVEDRNWDKSGQTTENAIVQLGVIPNSDPIQNWSVFGAISASGISRVWDGQSVGVSCNCSVTIDPKSIMLFSDHLPTGLSLSQTALSSGSPIGYLGADGELRSGEANAVSVEATLVVRLRSFAPGR